MTPCLVVVHFQAAIVLTWQCGKTDDDQAVMQYLNDNGGPSIEGEEFSAMNCGLFVDPQENGIYLARLSLIDEGPGDLPGSRECSVEIVDLRAVTKEEWLAYAGGEYPWEEPE